MTQMNADKTSDLIPPAACRAAWRVPLSASNGETVRSESATPVGWQTTLPIGSRELVGFFIHLRPSAPSAVKTTPSRRGRTIPPLRLDREEGRGEVSRSPSSHLRSSASSAVENEYHRESFGGK